MRIGLVIYGTLDTRSGGYLYDRRLVQTCRAAGDTVEIISLPWSGYGRHLLHNLQPALYRRLLTGSFDLLLQDELNHPSLFILNRILRRRRSIPLLSIVHHLRCSERRAPWKNWLYTLVERRYLAGVDGFICNSRATERAVFAQLGTERPSIVAHPGGDRWPQANRLTPAAIRERALRPGPLRLLFVGNLIPRKGLHRLLPVLAQLPPDSWRLQVVGETAVQPAYHRRIQRQMEELALNDRVTLAGGLDDAALAAEMAGSDLLVVTSSYEGFGIVYLEGMAFGLPAVATDAGGAGEIVTDGVDGFMCAAHDLAPLGERLRALAADRERLAVMSAAARARFERHPGWETSMGRIRAFMAAQLEAFHERL